MLSLTDEAKATANKERLDKICQTLSEAYHLGNLRLQTEPWQDDKGWETPVMRRNVFKKKGGSRRKICWKRIQRRRQSCKPLKRNGCRIL